VPDNERITAERLQTWTVDGGTPMRGVVIAAALGDHTPIRIAIARNMRDRAQLLDGYRDRLKIAGAAGALFALLFGYWLIRTALAPLREIVANTGRITVDKLDTRLDASRAARAARAGRRAERDARAPAAGVRAPVAVQRGSRARPAYAAEQHARRNGSRARAAALGRRIPGAARIEPRGIRPSRADDRQRAVSRARRAPELRHAAARIRRARRTRSHRRILRGLADEAGSTLRVEGHGRLTADVELFRRAIGNLLANALRYTPAGGVITLAVDETADAVQVVVANPGEPIDAALLPRIFDRFVRGDPARSGGAPGGTAGLGLAIVRSVMELHGGSVRVESDARGTRFILTFNPPPPA
jgi:two-component system heavy metal sensor histidine kinase CusS